MNPKQELQVYEALEAHIQKAMNLCPKCPYGNHKTAKATMCKQCYQEWRQLRLPQVARLKVVPRWRQIGPEQDKIAPQCAQTPRAFVK